MFVEAMVTFQAYDIYDIDLSRTGCDDLQTMLLDTTLRLVIRVEDLDQYICGGDGLTPSAQAGRVLGFGRSTRGQVTIDTTT
jgi:hypothetical protein